MNTAPLAELAERYDAFLVDQFGVLLDGRAAYPLAPAALSRLAAYGKPVILLSNSGKRTGPNERRLESLGFERSSYRLVLSSGEAAHAELKRRIAAGAIAAGCPTLLITSREDRSVIEGLDLALTDDPRAAELVLITGAHGEREPLERYEELIRAPASRRVPCICANPDITMLLGGQRFYAPGRVARLYEELGGEAELIGKPHPLIYEVAARMLDGVEPSRVLCIGDSPAHDIVGGSRAGHATALTIGTGLHSGSTRDQIEEALAEAGANPDHLIERFEF